MEVRMENLLVDIEAYSQVSQAKMSLMNLLSKVESVGSCRF